MQPCHSVIVAAVAFSPATKNWNKSSFKAIWGYCCAEISFIAEVFQHFLVIIHWIWKSSLLGILLAYVCHFCLQYSLLHILSNQNVMQFINWSVLRPLPPPPGKLPPPPTPTSSPPTPLEIKKYAPPPPSPENLHLQGLMRVIKAVWSSPSPH